LSSVLFALLAGTFLVALVLVFRDQRQRRKTLRELGQQRQLFEQTFDLAGVGMAHISVQGQWLRVNRRLCENTGYSEPELLQLSLPDIIHPDDRQTALHSLRELMEGRANRYAAEHRVIARDQHTLWVALQVSLVPADKELPAYGICVIEDISARHKIEQDNLLASQQYKALFDQMPEGVLLVDDSMRVVDHNREAARQLQHSSEQLLQLHIWDFEAVDDHAAIEQRRIVIEEKGRSDFESVYRTRGGQLIHVDVSVQFVKLLDGRQLYQILFHDISDRKQAAERIEHMAYYDQLTGLANRRLLNDRMERAISGAIRREAHIAVFYLDLDHFKVVNDSLGHQVGDRLLQIVARRLRIATRADDTIARMGGDEFVIMLNNISNEEAAASIAQKVIDELTRPMTIDNEELHITPSIGISLCPQDGRDAQELLKHADAALYQAKRMGRATYRFFTEALNENARERLNVERLLRKAIANDEFELYFQPQVLLGNGQIIGAEGLIRWNQPGIGLVTPGKFIPIAENSNLIVQIGNWVMQQACRQARLWQDKGFNLKVSFNVSARQFMHPAELLGSLRAALTQSGVDARRIGVELTESLLIDPQQMGDVLQEISVLGVQLALDDFGTGFSSLSYLRRFPIDILKIDQSFVSNADTDEDDAEMVKTIIGMAHNLRMKLVAEGVETARQAELLTEQGCEVAQGYHFSRPLTVTDFEALLRRQSGQ
jgi:diguanylate cyclase (GGDEF)-like protein/PAS domain S-box-containing protein